MAAIGAQEVKKKDDNDLTCSICLEHFKEPKLLPCGHTFCKDCLEKTFQLQQEKEKKAKTFTPTLKANVDEGVTKTQSPPFTVGLEPKGQCEDKLLTVTSTVEDDETELEPGMDELELVSMDPEPGSKEDPEPAPEIKCPVCNARHPIPSGGIEGFMTDYAADQRVEQESVTRSISSSKLMCGSCSDEDSNEIVGHCDECNDFVCKDCAKAHKKYAVYKSHTVTPLNEFTSEKHTPKKKSQRCNRHGEKITLYCTTCSILICHVCSATGYTHNNHEIYTLEDADKALCGKVSQMSEIAKQNLKTFQSYHEYVLGVEKEMGEGGYVEELKKVINKSFEERIENLRAQQRQLVAEVELNADQAKKKVWAQKAFIETTIARIEAGLRFMGRANICISTPERITMNTQGRDLLDQVTEVEWSHHDSIPSPLVYRCEPNQASALTECGKVSPISSDDVDIETETVNDRGYNIKRKKHTQPETKVGKHTVIKVKFSVPLVKDPFFQILYGKSKQILDTSQVAFYKSVEDEYEENTWEIQFVPRCAGTHSVQVWLGGVEFTVKEFSVTGQPTVGQRVQPGPDWKSAQTLPMTQGRVTACDDSIFRKTITVNWDGNEDLLQDNNIEYAWGQDEKYEVELCIVEDFQKYFV